MNKKNAFLSTHNVSRTALASAIVVALYPEASLAFIQGSYEQPGVAGAARSSYEQEAGPAAAASVTVPSLHAMSRINEVVLVDSQVEDADELLHGMRPGVKVIRMGEGKGIESIAAQLDGMSGLSAIHIISHGRDGGLQLGGSFIGKQQLKSHSKALRTIGNALRQGGDILLYGCDVAATDKGVGFVKTLAKLTGADVTASNNRTAATAKGGDWDLEIATGQIETNVPFAATAMNDYSHDLAIIPVTSNADSGPGTLRNAISSAASGDTITFSSAMAITLSSGQLSIEKNLTIDGDLDNNGTPDVTVDANYTSRVLSISGGTNVTLDGLVITKGLLSGAGGQGARSSATAGGAALGAGINNAGTLTILHSTITGNVATGGGGGGAGDTGGLYWGGYGGGGGSGFGTSGGAAGGDAIISAGTKAGAAGSSGSGGGGAGYYAASGSTGGNAYGATYGRVGGNGGTSSGGGAGGGITTLPTAAPLRSGGDGGTAGATGGGGGGSGYTGTGNGGAGGNAVGGIYSSGTLYIENTTLSNNLGAGGGGGGAGKTSGSSGTGGTGTGAIWNNGGSLYYNAGTTDLTTGNVGGNGGDGGNTTASNPGTTGTSGIRGTVTSSSWSSNTAPVLGGTFTTAGTVNDNATMSPFSQVTVTDADADNVSVSITYTGANGTLSGTGVTGSAGSYTVTSAAPATATTNLQGIVFTPTPNQVAPGSTVVTSFTLTPNDGTVNGTANSTTQVTATSINDAPVITSNGGGATASTSINENTTAVTTVTSSDADTGETYTYSISGGLDQAKFSINSSTGVLTFASAPDFENPTDNGGNNVYDVQVTVTDSGLGTLTDVQDIAVTVNNINDAPVITSDGGGATASVNAAENQTAVTTVTAIDQDTADTLSYSISGGADSAKFGINSSTGVLTFLSAPNYEVPTDSGTNGVYDVQVTVTDNGSGLLTDVQAIAVTVTNVNEAPVITSNGGGATASTSINENSTAVTTVTATDVDTADTLTYSISGGADAAKFSINSSTGALTFATAPDYENPTDSGANNVYDVQVTVTDNGTGTLTDVQALAVTVNNVNEAPTITGAPSTVPKDGVLFSFIPTSSDPDAGTTLTYSINTKPGWASFNTATGELNGTPAVGDIGITTSGIVITASDGSLSASLAPFDLTVQQGNQAPTISGTPATTVSGYKPYSFTPTASDVDGDILTFSITNKPAWASFNTATGALTGTPLNSDVGTTSGVLISVSDGTSTTSLAAFDLTVTENLDIDGDGMPNDWETAHGLDPMNPADASADPDGDGLTNLQEYLAGKNPAVDDNPPVVTAPADVTVDALGLFTPVTLGAANATDALDGSLSPSSDSSGYFKPGVHTVTWSATDAAGNTGTATQTVNVVPLVSFSKDQTTAEGANVTFGVILNGPAVSYPVSVPYTVSGTASTDGSDHSLVNGTAVINSGTEVLVSFTTVNDGVGEGTEDIVVTMGTPSNAVAGAKTVHTIALVEGNVAPEVSLSAEQGAGTTRTIVSGNGPVTVSSTVLDPNVADSHSYDWSGSDNALVDSDGATDTFTFDPASLSPGLYTLRVTVSDGTASDEAMLAINVVASAPSLSATADSDGDRIDDAAEGYGDSDNDGVPDYLDAIDSANVLQAQGGVSTSHLLETEPGVAIMLGTVALQLSAGQAAVSLSDLENFGGIAADTDYGYAGGIFDFIVDGLPVAGQSVQVVLPQLAAIPANAVYRKTVGGMWQNFVEDGSNTIASAVGEAGYCPPPGDAAYTAGLTAGHWCVLLTVEDGGPNDADGLANNSVTDPGGVATLLAQPVTVRVSGGGLLHPLWLLLLGLLALPRMLQGRARQ